ncbi:hypothetical protein CBL_20854 [Carabus blaptoides fortunei]
MSAYRYKAILQYIRFDNDNTRPARLLESKSAAIDDVWNMLMFNLERLYVPVDPMDQMVGGYTCERGTNRWSLSLFYNMLDVAGLAAFIIHDKLGHVKRNVRRRVFLMELAEQLVVPHIEQRATNPIVRGIQHVKQAMALFGVEVATGPPIDDQPAHVVSSAIRPSRSLCYKFHKKNSEKLDFIACIAKKKTMCQQHSHARTPAHVFLYKSHVGLRRPSCTS